ncbi:MAG: hypothetical protein ACRCS8_01155 [Brevinema sp.]
MKYLILLTTLLLSACSVSSEADGERFTIVYGIRYIGKNFDHRTLNCPNYVFNEIRFQLMNVSGAKTIRAVAGNNGVRDMGYVPNGDQGFSFRSQNWQYAETKYYNIEEVAPAQNYSPARGLTLTLYVTAGNPFAPSPMPMPNQLILIQAGRMWIDLEFPPGLTKDDIPMFTIYIDDPDDTGNPSGPYKKALYDGLKTTRAADLIKP